MLVSHNIHEVGGFETQQIVDLGGKSRMTFCVNSGERDAQYSKFKIIQRDICRRGEIEQLRRDPKTSLPEAETQRDELAASTIY